MTMPSIEHRVSRIELKKRKKRYKKDNLFFRNKKLFLKKIIKKKDFLK